MGLKVLIAPDKFKGTLSARAAAEAMARGWRRARPGDTITLLPITDGGDGFGAVMGELLRARKRVVRAVDAAHRPCSTAYWLEAGTETAIIESASSIGLARLPARRFHPFELDTFGLGVVLKAAARGAKNCMVGVGGSATNEGGFGLACALGWRFLDRHGRAIERWTDCSGLREIRPPDQRRLFRSVRVAVDVQNPLLGQRGATRVYGPQKGVRPRDFGVAERALRRLEEVYASEFGRELGSRTGAGAGGGLGFGLMAFLGARLEPGFGLFARHVKLGRLLSASDVVITGEGAIDASTFMGKGVGQIIRECDRLRIRCIAVGGVVDNRVVPRTRFLMAGAMTDVTSRERAVARPGFWLERAAAAVGRGFPGVLSGCGSEAVLA